MIGGARFSDLSATEQDKVLLGAVVAADVARTGLGRFMRTAAPILFWPLTVLALVASVQGVPLWLLVTLAVLMYFVGVLAAQFVLWNRRAVYQLDCRLAELMGRPYWDGLADLESREGSQIPKGFITWYCRLVVPSRPRRVKRLDAATRCSGQGWKPPQ
ncbi:hypothetical protein EBN03_28725 [Nocardia stercoris]|uniref:Uncharacterized protein n=1 Tax=Nocardia stercoris TaxID=2483361 RepID=A0A3M2L2W4_9NOCA|nr:hypothetical protein EBN03_28725 [Nocardia stercoris]